MRKNAQHYQCVRLLLHKDLHGVFHSWGASPPCPRANMMNTTPGTANTAPIQSTRLSSSPVGRSRSIDKYPMQKVNAQRPAWIKNIARQPILYINIDNPTPPHKFRTYVVISVRKLPRTRPRASPQGAPAANAENAIRRLSPGGKD